MIEEFQKSYSVNLLCRTFDVHRSSYRHWAKRSKAADPARIKLQVLVKENFNKSEGSLGARTIASLITNDKSNDVELNRYHCDKLMKELDLQSRQPCGHKYKKATKPHNCIDNLLNREFSPIAPNQVWCGDVTYYWEGNYWSYLAVVLDLYGRKVVGYAISNSLDSELSKRALRNAFESRGRPKGVMFHSGQGCYYTSESFRE